MGNIDIENFDQILKKYGRETIQVLHTTSHHTVRVAKHPKTGIWSVVKASFPKKTGLTPSEFVVATNLLQKVNCSAIIPVIGAKEIDGCYIIEFKYCARQFLQEIDTISSKGDEITLSCAKSLLTAIRFLHDHNICHMDIKPENILLDEDDQLYLTDFDLCVAETRQLKKPRGTPQYMAPELKDPSLKQVTDLTKCDVYSAGLVILEMIIGGVCDGRYQGNT